MRKRAAAFNAIKLYIFENPFFEGHEIDKIEHETAVSTCVQSLCKAACRRG